MNLTSRLGRSVTGARNTGLALPTSSRGVARVLTTLFLATALFVVAGVAGLALYASSHADRVYQGVHVSGVDISGLSPKEAEATLAARFATYAAQPLTLAAGDQRFALTPAEAGARLDSAATVAAAMAWGREGSPIDRSRAWARALLLGTEVPPLIEFDPAVARRGIAAFAPDIVKPAINASIAYDAAGQPEIVPDVTGVRLDYAATASSLEERIARFGSDPVTLVTQAELPAVTMSSLSPALPDLSAAVDAPLTLSAGALVWHVPATDLQPLLGYDARASLLSIDSRPLNTLVTALAAEVDHEAVDAGITVDGNGRLAVVPAITSATVDIDASVAAIANGLLDGEDEVLLVVDETSPEILDDMAAAAVERGEALMDPGIALTWNGGEGQLDRGDLLRALTIRSRPGAEQPFVFDLDPDLIREDLNSYAAEFDIPVQDARWRLSDGKIQLAVPDSKGRELDIDKGVTSVLAAFNADESKVELSVRTLTPEWQGKDGAAITLGSDILGEGGTWYGDSSDARRNNIELASSHLSGWLIPPGGVFSYADNIGLITEENGFSTGYGIVDDGGGGFTTAPVVGGGICQVSTTLFQAAFWAGLPILERYQHPYYMRTYGEAVTGLPGLDAMVNIESDWRLDLRFQNTTNYWMAVVLIPDGATIYARIVGTDPGWDVVVPEPTISNEVTADTAMRYTESPEFPLGTETIVESARDGFDVRIDRTVKDGSKVILEDSFSSSFAPARNTTMRGTGTGTE